MSEAADDFEPNVRSSSYSLVQGRMQCPQCDSVTAVFACALPAGYESRYVDDGPVGAEIGTWEVQTMAAVLSYIESLPDTVANHIRALTQHFRLAPDEASGETFWINHCEHCGAQMEEEELHEFDGPFGPMPGGDPESIHLHRFREPFAAWAGGESHDLNPLDS